MPSAAYSFVADDLASQIFARISQTCASPGCKTLTLKQHDHCADCRDGSPTTRAIGLPALPVLPARIM